MERRSCSMISSKELSSDDDPDQALWDEIERKDFAKKLPITGSGYFNLRVAVLPRDRRF